MADNSAIEWTDATWNPVRGCTRVSPGCGGPGPHGGCYAEGVAARFSQPARGDWPAQPYHGLAEMRGGKPRWTGRIMFVEEALALPMRWRTPRRIFVNSMSDLFHEGVTDGQIMRVLWVMTQAYQHTFQILTKRPARMHAFFRKWAEVNPDEDRNFKGAHGPEEVRKAHKSGRGQLFADMLDAMGPPPAGAAYPLFDWAGGMAGWPDVLPNVWLGTSVEDQVRADERRYSMAMLAGAGWRTFVSYEPALARVDWTGWEFLAWLISGGESGPRARPSHPSCHRDARDFCAMNGIPYFFKQWGEWAPRGPECLGYPAVDGVPVRKVTSTGEDGSQIESGGEAPVWMQRLGKKRAGRGLDGVEHSAMPEARHA